MGHASNNAASFTEFIIPFVWDGWFRDLEGRANKDARFTNEVLGELCLWRDGQRVDGMPYKEFLSLWSKINNTELNSYNAKSEGLRVHVNGEDAYCRARSYSSCRPLR